jgi:hypothetical protein
VDFLVSRDDFRRCRFAEAPVPSLERGQALLEIEAFGLTSNNVTYAVLGDSFSYWRFFPAPEGWGRVPVWGFARVAESSNAGVEPGLRVFGYLPPSTHLVVTPERAGAEGFVDAAPHRAEMAAVYNRYVRADPGGRYEEHDMLLRPLFGTSWLIAGDLADNGFFGAGAVMLSSASSKTALGTAFMLGRQGGIEVIGLTSPARLGFVEGLDVYDRVIAYEEIGSLPRQRAVYVDMSGDARVRAAVHHHYGEELARSVMVGATHWEQIGGEPLPGPEPVVFFAPDVIARRGGLGAGVGETMKTALEWSAGWLRIERGRGPEAVERAYLELVDGRSEPAAGHVLSLA